MFVRRSIRPLLAASAAAAALLMAGCGLQPGDYQAYRIAYSSAPLVAACYPNGEIPLDDKYDKTTFEAGATFVIYLDADSNAFLDLGSRVLEGSIDADAYSFSGKDTNVEYAPGTTIFDSDHDGIDDGDNPFVDSDGDNLDDQLDDPEVDVDMDGLDDRGQDNLVDVNDDGEDDRIVEVPSDTKFTVTSTLTIDMTASGPGVTGKATSKVSTTCKGSFCPDGFDTSCSHSNEFKGIKIDRGSVDFNVDNAGGNP